MNQKSVESGVQAAFKKIVGCSKAADTDFSQTKTALEDIERYVALIRLIVDMAPPKKSKNKKKAGSKKRKVDEIAPVSPVIQKP